MKQIFQSPNYHIRFGVMYPHPLHKSVCRWEYERFGALNINHQLYRYKSFYCFPVWYTNPKIDIPNHILFEQSNIIMANGKRQHQSNGFSNSKDFQHHIESLKWSWETIDYIHTIQFDIFDREIERKQICKNEKKEKFSVFPPSTYLNPNHLNRIRRYLVFEKREEKKIDFQLWILSILFSSDFILNMLLNVINWLWIPMSRFLPDKKTMSGNIHYLFDHFNIINLNSYYYYHSEFVILQKKVFHFVVRCKKQIIFSF